MTEKLLTPADVAERCQLSTTTVLRAIRAGRLRASRLGEHAAFRVRPEDVDAWIAASVLEPVRKEPPPLRAVPRPSDVGRLVITPDMGRASAYGRTSRRDSYGSEHARRAGSPLAMIERRERRRRDGTVYAVWRARWRDETGAERSKTFDRAADARAWEAKVRMMKRGGALAELDAGTETLAEFVEEWWLVYAGPNLERSTLRTYAQLWNGHALTPLGHLQLRQLTPQTVARFRAELEGAGVGNEAIRKTMTMLQGVLQRAVEWGRVSSNAVKITRKPPKKYRPAVQAIPPSVIEVMRARLLETGRLRDASLLVVLAYAGLRPQEALALEWRPCASGRCSSSARSRMVS